MAYDKQEWKDGEDGGTPITAERLNHMEEGISDKAERGPKGKNGSNGKDGRGIESIERDGNTLVFKMTEGENIEVDLPEE